MCMTGSGTRACPGSQRERQAGAGGSAARRTRVLLLRSVPGPRSSAQLVLGPRVQDGQEPWRSRLIRRVRKTNRIRPPQQAAHSCWAWEAMKPAGSRDHHADAGQRPQQASGLSWTRWEIERCPEFQVWLSVSIHRSCGLGGLDESIVKRCATASNALVVLLSVLQRSGNTMHPRARNRHSSFRLPSRHEPVQVGGLLVGRAGGGRGDQRCRPGARPGARSGHETNRDVAPWAICTTASSGV
jgi:hypothetical protein